MLEFFKFKNSKNFYASHSQLKKNIISSTYIAYIELFHILEIYTATKLYSNSNKISQDMTKGKTHGNTIYSVIKYTLKRKKRT